MSTNDVIRQGQKKVDGNAAGLVSELARATGVREGDVEKVLEQLGLSRSLPGAIRLNGGQEPLASSARIAFRVGRTTLIM
jgi:hypothetical protein